MIRGNYYNYLTFLISILLFSCSTDKKNTTNDLSAKSDSLNPLFAQNFTVQKQGNLTILSIGEAWRDAKEKFQYVLYPKGSKVPNGFDNAVKIAVPVERVICTGTSQLAFLDFIDQTDKIVAIADGNYVYNEKIREKIKSGSIPELGNDQAMNYEKALTMNPELVFAFSFGRTQSHKKFEELGIPVVMISEFMEDSPLGRAEWVVFMSYFFRTEVQAKLAFDKIAKNYFEIQQLTKNLEKEQQPKVLVGMAQEGSWFVPGGKSFIAKFIEDAGGIYLWANNEERGGVPIDFEAVLYKAQKADKWLNVVLVENKKQLLASDSRYAAFDAFNKSEIYSYTARISENGGYDFFESAIVRPDLVLSDLLFIFHPNLIAKHQLLYYKRLP